MTHTEIPRPRAAALALRGDDDAAQVRRRLIMGMAACGIAFTLGRKAVAGGLPASDPGADPQDEEGWAADAKAKPAAASGVPTDGDAQFASIPGSNINFKVLNFALTLEILEADVYRQALNVASGRDVATPLLPQAQAGNYTRTVGDGGLAPGAADIGFLYLVQFAYVEAAHRDFLATAISSLGDTPVSANPKGYKLPALQATDVATILRAGILPLEETGVRAYLGALPYLTDLSLAQTAGTIYTTEARHSAAIEAILGINPGPRRMPGDVQVTKHQPHPNTFEYFLQPTTVLAAASQFFVS